MGTHNWQYRINGMLLEFQEFLLNTVLLVYDWNSVSVSHTTSGPLPVSAATTATQLRSPQLAAATTAAGRAARSYVETCNVIGSEVR